jgi:hypothetical protein
VLYETKAGFWEGIPSEDNWKSTLQEGFLILTENSLDFKPFNVNSGYHERIIKIKEIHRKLVNSTPYIQITNTANSTTSYLGLKSNSWHTKEDQLKTDELFELISQAKDYKEAEKLQIKEKRKELIQQIGTMLAVSNRLRMDTMRTILNMEENEFYENVFNWAEKFNFIIDRDEIIVDHNAIPQFMYNLTMGFQYSNIPPVKLKCPHCGKLVDYSAKICSYCGKEMSI